MIRRFRDLPEALLAKSILESAGIESFLGDENIVRIDWFYSNLVGGIKLLVRAQDAETASKVTCLQNVPEKFRCRGRRRNTNSRGAPGVNLWHVAFDELNKRIAYGGMLLFVGLPIPIHQKRLEMPFVWVCMEGRQASVPALPQSVGATSLVNRTGGLVAFHGERHSIAAAEAKGRDAALQVAALQFVKQRHQDAGATGANRMAERHCATVHVYLFRI